MVPWVPSALTGGLPLATIALALVATRLAPNDLWPYAIPLLGFPVALGAGYLAAGLGLRGLAVAMGGLGIEVLGLLVLYAAPRDFEDAGVLVVAIAALVALVMLAYAGWAAYDVWRVARV